MRKHLLTFLIFAGAATAGPLLQVTVDTGAMGLNGDTGSIDFMFNPGAGSQAATVQISNFTGASYINATQVDNGDVSGGPVPSLITINTTDGDNDDFEAVTFGNTLTFDASFSGPAVDSPSGSALGTDLFSFFVYSDQAGTVAALTTDVNGTAGTVTVNLDGTLSTEDVSTNFSAATPTPEPSTMWLMLGALVLLAGFAWMRRKAIV